MGSGNAYLLGIGDLLASRELVAAFHADPAPHGRPALASAGLDRPCLARAALPARSSDAHDASLPGRQSAGANSGARSDLAISALARVSTSSSDHEPLAALYAQTTTCTLSWVYPPLGSIRSKDGLHGDLILPLQSTLRSSRIPVFSHTPLRSLPAIDSSDTSKAKPRLAALRRALLTRILALPSGLSL